MFGWPNRLRWTWKVVNWHLRATFWCPWRWRWMWGIGTRALVRKQLGYSHEGYAMFNRGFWWLGGG